MCLADGGGQGGEDVSSECLAGKDIVLGHVPMCTRESPFPFSEVAGNGASLKSIQFCFLGVGPGTGPVG